MTTITRIPTDSRIRIALDPAHDLNEAGLDTARADDFAAAWHSALEAIAARLGLTDVQSADEIHDSARAYDYETRTPFGDDESIEVVLWQLAHDACYDDGAEWQWDDARVETQIAALRRYIA